jgi:hypothetical protein
MFILFYRVMNMMREDSDQENQVCVLFNEYYYVLAIARTNAGFTARG